MAEERLRKKTILGMVVKRLVDPGFFRLTVWISPHTKVSDDLYRMEFAREKVRYVNINGEIKTRSMD